MMVEHAREHAAEIHEWRAELDEAINPAAVLNDMAEKTGQTAGDD